MESAISIGFEQIYYEIYSESEKLIRELIENQTKNFDFMNYLTISKNLN